MKLSFDVKMKDYHPLCEIVYFYHFTASLFSECEWSKASSVKIWNNNSGIFNMQIDQDEEEDQMELVEKFIESLKQEQLHSTLLPFQREHYDLLK